MADDKQGRKPGRHVRKQGDAERRAGVLPERDLVENMRGDADDLKKAHAESKKEPGRHRRAKPEDDKE
jgi:hypothetical protein